MSTIAKCRCGATYTAETWAKLELVGNVDGFLQQRNCVCGSTISTEILPRCLTDGEPVRKVALDAFTLAEIDKDRRQAPEPTLTEALEARGFEHRKGAAPGYERETLRGGEVVFVGTAAATWEWLKGGAS